MTIIESFKNKEEVGYQERNYEGMLLGVVLWW